MNFLAHCHLSDGTAPSLVGSVLADFLKGRSAHLAYPPEVQRGIAIHRAVDRFTDAHPAVAACCGLLRPAWGRWSPVLMDLFFDHLLASDWERWHPGEGLRPYADRVYRSLQDAPYALPPRMEEAVRDMVRRDWLASYATEDGLWTALRRMSGRLSRRVPLEEATGDMLRYRKAITVHFEAFLPQAEALAHQVHNEFAETERTALPE